MKRIPAEKPDAGIPAHAGSISILLPDENNINIH